ncbi:MAG: hypothetical protein VBE63_29070, partial [Lamprobacter sp.]|uniref:hypothetical protein n=1 Tax=Lamprobacter sp. TaxID=3100796 RepID=UPI002B25C76B
MLQIMICCSANSFGHIARHHRALGATPSSSASEAANQRHLLVLHDLLVVLSELLGFEKVVALLAKAHQI